MTDVLRANCKRAIYLIKNIDAKLVFADHVYDTNKIFSELNKQNIKPIIPPKCNYLDQRCYEPKIYCLSYIIENAFLDLKRCHAIAIYYAKNLDVFIISVFVYLFVK